METLKYTNPIKLNKLISLILHFFKRSNNLFQKVQLQEFKVNIHYKKENEKFTEADWLLQKMFENYMAKYFPTITIIGEEDTSDNLIKESEFFKIEDESEIDFDLVKESDLPENLREIKYEELGIYIDPIDSTEQFIKRNFAPVTSLVGITRNTEAFLGFIYFPYFEGKDNKSLVFMNIPTKGIFCYDTQKGQITPVDIKRQDEDKWTFVSSGSRTTENMKSLFSLFDNSTTLLVHGLGGKAIECILYDYIFLASGTTLGLWDVCAGHCLNKELGGGVFYLDGKEIHYPKEITTRNLADFCFMTNNAARVSKFVDVYSKSNIKF